MKVYIFVSSRFCLVALMQRHAQHMGGDKIKALAKVIPRMESPSDARLLKNTVLR